MSLNRDLATPPLYHQIRDLLLDEIQNGGFLPENGFLQKRILRLSTKSAGSL